MSKPDSTRDVIHKADTVATIKCGQNLRGDGWSTYWDAVTCPACLAVKPADAQGRTSCKQSHRAEGVNFVD